eukprot:gnl/Spiro4/598_TR344_c0_g1_i1.p1 gnl/Spiro4/598_TR344_c0_g1~~gnl/Spiro4/598_TR344_c0_g1_i1.p1  ORF type:complete len:242 (-),score=78.69 gnl/Spiro4/598_TR344_c0_g1_i1:274-969(-)
MAQPTKISQAIAKKPKPVPPKISPKKAAGKTGGKGPTKQDQDEINAMMSDLVTGAHDDDLSDEEAKSQLMELQEELSEFGDDPLFMRGTARADFTDDWHARRKAEKLRAQQEILRDLANCPVIEGEDVGDLVARHVARYQDRHGTHLEPIRIHRLDYNTFMFKGRKIVVDIFNGQLNVRVGGGYVSFDEMLVRYRMPTVCTDSVNRRLLDSRRRIEQSFDSSISAPAPAKS